MNLRSDKGFTGVDITIAMIVILIFIPTIFGSIYNIQKYNNGIKRETTALNMASDILEIAKATRYNELNLENESLFVNKMNEKYTNSGIGNSKYSYTGSDGIYYQIDIDLSNYYPVDIEVANRKDLIKKVNVVVTYMVGKQQKNVKIATAIQTPYI